MSHHAVLQKAIYLHALTDQGLSSVAAQIPASAFAPRHRQISTRFPPVSFGFVIFPYWLARQLHQMLLSIIRLNHFGIIVFIQRRSGLSMLRHISIFIEDAKPKRAAVAVTAGAVSKSKSACMRHKEIRPSLHG